VRLAESNSWTFSAQAIILASFAEISSENAMANALYKNHLLIWTVSYDQIKAGWIPKIFVSRPLNGKYELHSFRGPLQISEANAREMGKQLAEAWVDEKMEETGPSLRGV
jgi:hypothetical protein